MAKAKKETTARGVNGGVNAELSLLFQEKSDAIDSLVKAYRKGQVTDDDLMGQLDALPKSSSLSPAAQERLQLRAKQAFDVATAPTPPRPKGADIPLPNLQAQAADTGKARIVSAIKARLAGAAEPPELAALTAKLQQRVNAPLIAQDARPALAMASQVGATAMARTRAAEQIKTAQTAGGFDPFRTKAVQAAQERIATAKSVPGVELAASEGAAEAAAGRSRKLGVGGIGAGLLAGLVGMKLFGGSKQEGIDPQVQLALAQRLGGGDQGGGQSTSKTLMDASRLLTLIKNIQGMAGMQGPAEQPRLI